MIEVTGTKLFISTDPLPKNPTKEDFDRLEWKELGEITEVQNVAIKTDKFMCFGDIRAISDSIPIKPIY